MEPDLAADIVFGARALLLLEGAVRGPRCSQCWEQGRARCAARPACDRSARSPDRGAVLLRRPAPLDRSADRSRTSPRICGTVAGWADEVIVVDGSPRRALRRARRRPWRPSVRTSPPRSRSLVAERQGRRRDHRRPSGPERAGRHRRRRRPLGRRRRCDAAVALLDEADLVRPAELLRPARLARPLGHRPLPAQPRLHRRRAGRRLPGHASRCGAAAAGDRAATTATSLFENLELMRTVAAAGGRMRHPLDLYVRASLRPSRHFLSQRVRQAYDDWAMPGRMAAFLAIVPGLVWPSLSGGGESHSSSPWLRPPSPRQAGEGPAAPLTSRSPGRCWRRSGSPSGRSASGSRSGAASTAGVSNTAAAV